MLTEGIDCLCCKKNKMKKTNRLGFYEGTGLDEFVVPICRFVAYFVGNGNEELNVSMIVVSFWKRPILPELRLSNFLRLSFVIIIIIIIKVLIMVLVDGTGQKNICKVNFTTWAPHQNKMISQI